MNFEPMLRFVLSFPLTDVLVTQVINRPDPSTVIQPGFPSTINANVDIRFREKPATTGAKGENLWKLSTWISSRADGTGRQYSYREQSLNDEQQSQYYKKKEPFGFTNLPIEFDGQGGLCTDFVYVCVKFERGDNPVINYDLGFNFQGFPNNDVLTNCAEIPDCQGRLLKIFSNQSKLAPPSIPYFE